MKLRRGDLAGARAAIRELGYVTDFAVVGPFDNEGKSGFARAFGPEEQRMAAFEPATTFEGKERDVSWRAYPSDASLVGYVDFDAVFRPFENVCGYAETMVTSERAQTLAISSAAAARRACGGTASRSSRTTRTVGPIPIAASPIVAAHAGAESPAGEGLRVGRRRGASSCASATHAAAPRVAFA